jgi:hydroxymethylpyrimidine pyrophosphatase-like HAD family hydrolase
MTKKLIFIDLDGTLLNDSFELTPCTQNVLKRISEKGHKVVLASGRPPRAILPYYEELGLKTPFIAYNGTYVIDCAVDCDEFVLPMLPPGGSIDDIITEL